MATYSMTFREVMDLPMRVFWFISGNVDRLRFEQATLKMEIECALKSEESTKEMHEQLRKLAPSPFTLSGRAQMEISSKADPDAVDTLRALAG